MTEARARELLKDFICGDNSLYNCGAYLCWNFGEKTIVIDHRIDSVEFLEAVCWWIRHHE